MHVTLDDIARYMLDTVVHEATTHGQMSKEQAVEIFNEVWLNRCFAHVFKTAYLHGLNGDTVEVLNEPK